MNAAFATATVTVRRIIPAPAEDLFDAWLDPQALSTWMRPGSIQKTTAKLDVRVGGRYEILMESDTDSYPTQGEYRVIDRPRRLVFTWISRGTEHRESLVTVDFIVRGENTEVVVTHDQLPEGGLQAHTNGWSSALERLEGAACKGY